MKTQTTRLQQEPLNNKMTPFVTALLQRHKDKPNCPSTGDVQRFLDGVLSVLIPGYGQTSFLTEKDIELALERTKIDLLACLSGCSISKSMTAATVVTDFEVALPALYAELIKDAEAIENGDPAANGIDEVMRTYPGFLAIATYRIAHFLKKEGVEMIPRILTEIAHSRTGIDIHPGAQIGSYFFIDHGTGVVIGETTVIGDNVKIYQGVTLGALSVDKSMKETKRHPSIENNVVIYSGATILGGNTVIGEGSIIGGNAWVTKSVPAFSKVFHTPSNSVKTTKS